MDMYLLGYLIIMGLAVLIIAITCGLLIPYLRVLRKMKYYEKVQAKVIDIKMLPYDGAGSSMHYTYEFFYNGNQYIIEDKNYSPERKREQYSKGDTIDIYIEPNNPEVYLPPNRVRHRYKMMFFIVWLLAMLIPIFLWIIFSRI